MWSSAHSIVDSSRVSTFFISILLIVYGSFRSLALEEDKEGRLWPANTRKVRRPKKEYTIKNQSGTYLLHRPPP